MEMPLSVSFCFYFQAVRYFPDGASHMLHTLHTGDSEDCLVRWNTEDGRADDVTGKGHAGAQVRKDTGRQIISDGPFFRMKNTVIFV